MITERFDAVVFDMDGVLLDSEPFWFEAERAALAQVGIELTEDLFSQTMGLRVNEAVQHWRDTRPWTVDISNQKIESDMMDAVSQIVRERGVILPGVKEALSAAQNAGLKVGLATSSLYRIVDVVLDTLALRPFFDDVYSAEDEPYGKPHPGVYLTAANRLGVKPERCIAIEDSINGVNSAVAAGCFTIAVPDSSAWATSPDKFDVADVILKSLIDLDLGVLVP